MLINWLVEFVTYMYEKTKTVCLIPENCSKLLPIVICARFTIKVSFLDLFLDSIVVSFIIIALISSFSSCLTGVDKVFLILLRLFLLLYICFASMLYYKIKTY